MNTLSILLSTALLLQSGPEFVRVASSSDKFKVIPCRPVLVGQDGQATDNLIVVSLGGSKRLVQGWLSLRCDESRLSTAAGDLESEVESPRAFAVKLFADDKVIWKRELSGGSTDRIAFSGTIDGEGAALSAEVTIQWLEVMEVESISVRFDWQQIRQLVLSPEANGRPTVVIDSISAEHVLHKTLEAVNRRYIKAMGPGESPQPIALALVCYPLVRDRLFVEAAAQGEDESEDDTEDEVDPQADLTFEADLSHVKIDFTIRLQQRRELRSVSETETIRVGGRYTAVREKTRKFEDVVRIP